MLRNRRPVNRVAYVLKRYPRYSEAFVVNEILAHEIAGLEICIFALRPPSDPHFQEAISRVQAPVVYLSADHVRADALWSTLYEVGSQIPRTWRQLNACGDASGSELYQALLLARELVARQIDHVHAHFATTAATVARLSSLFTDTPYTFTAHAKDIFHESVVRSELRQKIESAAGVVTVSDFNVHFLSEEFPDCSCKLRRIYNGLDLQEFRFAKPVQRQPKIVAVGRLVEKKGFESLIDACGLLRQAGIVFDCEIIGGGELELTLSSHIEQLKLESRVRLVGPRPLNYVKEAIRQAAVLAVPSVTASTGDRDGLPMILLEAMSLGTPCVATSVTGIPEVIRNEETGLLVPEGRPEALASALKALLSDIDLRVAVASAARCVIEANFEVHRNAEALREFFGNCRRASTSRPSLAEVS